MVSISKKVFGLASVATVFAGMAFGQATCAQSATANIIRAEGTTEQTSSLTITCTNAGGAATAVGTAGIQVFLSPALPVTSKLLSSSTGQTEIVAVGGAGGNTVNATVSGSTINFSGVALPAIAPGGGTFVITISNIRVNATSLSIGSGVPPSITATTFISGSAGSIVPAALTGSQIAFAQNGLGASQIYADLKATPTAGSNGYVVCNAVSPKIDNVNYITGNGATTNVFPVGTAAGSLAFVVRINENFPSAFKTAVGEASLVAQTIGGTSNAVTDGTRLNIAFANVPSGATVYVPTDAITSGQGAAVGQLTAKAPGTAFGAITASTATAVKGFVNATPVTVTSGSGSVDFEITTADANSLDRFDIPVFVAFAANSVVPSSSGITAVVTFSTKGSTVIPNFVSAGSNTVTGSTFNACSTSLLFPFVTNQLGFDTGIAISNTSSDPFGTKGATAQAGTCSLNFYGSGAPSPANVTTPNVPTGTTYTQVLSGVASGFQGYIIAQCSFQYAHGFAFITNGVGVNGGLSQGYLAGVIPDVNQVNRAANGAGSPALNKNGLGEVLGN